MSAPIVDNIALELRANPRLAVIYQQSDGGGWSPDDFADVKPNQALLSPVRPPEASKGGILLPGAAKDIPGMTALCYRVEAIGPIVKGKREHGGVDPRCCIVPRVGELVHVRNAMLDAAQPSCDLLWCDVQHIVGRVRLGPPSPRAGFFRRLWLQLQLRLGV